YQRPRRRAQGRFALTLAGGRDRARLIFALAIVSAFALSVAGARGAEDERLGPGSHRIELKFGGLDRSYVVHVPQQVSGGGALPAILNFHGAGSNAEQQERYSAMDAAADRDGFLAVYPNGTGRGTRALTWNAAGCCAYAERKLIDDVGFARALVGDLATRV